MTLKIRSFEILELFCVLYPICPGYFDIFGMQVKNLILFICFALIFISGRGLHGRKTLLRFTLPVIVYVICTCFSQLIHMELLQAVSHIVLWIGIVIFSSNIIKTKERFYRIQDLVIYTGAVVGIFGFIEEITHFNVFSLFNNVGTTLNYNPLRFGILRIISFTSHAISYCVYCMLVFGILLYRFGTASKKQKKYLYICGGIIIANALLTLSRIALLGIIIELLLYLFYSGHGTFLIKLFRYAVITAVIVGIGCLLSEKFSHAVQLAYYMVLAMFDDSYTSVLQANGFTDNAGGVGNRLDLYGWVFSELRGSFIVGKGATIPFSHVFINHNGYKQVKESIEVEWLRTLYRYGIIGLFGQVFFMVGMTLKAYKDRTLLINGVNYGKMVFSIMLAYMVVFFGVMQNQDIQLFAVIMMMFVAYYQYNGFEIQAPSTNMKLG